MSENESCFPIGIFLTHNLLNFSESNTYFTSHFDLRMFRYLLWETRQNCRILQYPTYERETCEIHTRMGLWQGFWGEVSVEVGSTVSEVWRQRNGRQEANSAGTGNRKWGALTLGVGQEAVERREVAWARGDSDGVVLRDAVSRGRTWTPREMMESGIWNVKEGCLLKS